MTSGKYTRAQELRSCRSCNVSFMGTTRAKYCHACRLAIQKAHNRHAWERRKELIAQGVILPKYPRKKKPGGFTFHPDTPSEHMFALVSAILFGTLPEPTQRPEFATHLPQGACMEKPKRK